MGKKVRVRSFVIGGIFTLLLVAMTTKLYWVQVVEGAELLSKAENAWSKREVLQPTRGLISDRNGKILAQDGEAFTVAVNPKLIDRNKHLEEVVQLLAPILDMESPEGLQKLRDRITAKRNDGSFLDQVEIRSEGWKIDKTVAELIKVGIHEQGIQGVYLLEEQKRYYPAGLLAAHVLGFVDKENIAKSGIELYYDELLKGTPGRITYEKDRLGYKLPNSQSAIVAPVDGQHLRLTIDRNIQHFIDEALEKMYAEFKPKGAMVIAADPNTMEILGMSNLPSYNPNAYWDFADHNDFINRNIGLTYEPGSTFKIVTLAGAVEQGIFKPEDTFQSGSIRVPGQTIGDHNNGQGWGEITYLDGLKRSSNVAFVKLGYEGLGKDKLRDYMDRFGFGQRTAIDLPGEVSGRINFHYPAEVAAATFGQGNVVVTALQQVAAVSAIANGGKLMRPYIMKEVIDSKTNKVISSTKPEIVRQVISEDTARKVSEYLEQVVSDQKIGTGRRAYIEGYRIAGKTGTAQKVVNGKYSSENYVVSFIGYAPADDPKIVLCVIVDDPDIGGDYRRGNEVSAPVFKEIMGKSLRYLNVPKENTSVGITELKDHNVLVMPDLLAKNVMDAREIIARAGIQYEVLGNGKTVLQQHPKAGDHFGIEQQAYLITESIQQISFPNLMGRSMRDALEVCTLLQSECTYRGEGYVVSQKIDMQSSPYSVDLRLEPWHMDAADGDQEDEEQEEQ